MDAVWSEEPIRVVWEGGRRYRGGRADGPSLVVDGGREVAPSPVEALVIALGSCSAIDIVDILEKRRTPVRRVEITIDFTRAEKPPRRLTAARVVYRIATDSELGHVQRAAALSFEKYCSVSTSLAPDIDLSWDVELDTRADGETGG